ncbi:hypothetical protein GQ600_25375 [Phytophthora cactorum]|nr:hypothetical protein GQ600_25375 [Phytophthora cactorum]
MPTAAVANSHVIQPDAAEARLRARLEDESKQPDADTALRANIEFWTRLRAILAANEGSYGLEALDNSALALMDEDSRGQAVLETQVQASEIFQAPTARTRSSKRNSSRTPTKTPPAKKQRTSKKARTVLPYRFDLAEDVEDRIRQDLDRLISKAAKKGKKTPPRAAYPWKRQRKHWLFWIRFRYIFLLPSLYPPTDNAASRRKMKASALQTRLQLLSALIEELEGVHDNLMCSGARPPSTLVEPSNRLSTTTQAQEDLAVVYKCDRRRYDRIIARALDPYQVDEDGYSSISELLEQSQALDPTRPRISHHLTDNALARIALDVASRRPPNESWVGNRTKGP